VITMTMRWARARVGAIGSAAVLLLLLGGAQPSAAADVRWRGIGMFTLREEAYALNLGRLNYQDSPMDPFRVHLFVDAAVSDRVAVFGQFLVDDTSSRPIRSYGMYALFSRFTPTDFSIEVGKIPTVFGTFGPRAYANKNPLVAAPLMYQYHTTLRADQLPLSAKDLLANRGRGQFGLAYTDSAGKFTGASTRFMGVPIVYDICWDFGLVGLGTWRRVEYALAITEGTVGVPVTGRDSNDGQQFIGRLGVVPVTGFRVTGSASRGPYLDRLVVPFLPKEKDLEAYNQTALGLAADWAWSHVSLNGELLRNEYESPWISEDLGLTSWYAEAKYAFAAGAYLAARFDRLKFDEIDVKNGTTGETERIGWDNDVQRIEAAVGYRFTPDCLVRYDVQLWDEDGEAWRTTHSASALQAVISF